MKTKTVYSIKLVNYLMKLGFNPITTKINEQKPEFMCWVYKDSPELYEAIGDYINSR